MKSSSTCLKHSLVCQFIHAYTSSCGVIVGMASTLTMKARHAKVDYIKFLWLGLCEIERGKGAFSSLALS